MSGSPESDPVDPPGPGCAPVRVVLGLVFTGLIAAGVSAYGWFVSARWYLGARAFGLEGGSAETALIGVHSAGIGLAALVIGYAWQAHSRTGGRHLRGLCCLPSYLAIIVSGNAFLFLIGDVLVI